MVALILAYEPDLLFSSKIENVGRRLGLNVEIVTSMVELHRILKQSSPEVMLVNLDALKERHESFTELASSGGSRVVGYYSHVDAKCAEEAVAAGFELIPRRTFAVKVYDILAGVRSG
jgi:hypothetical protein